MPDTPLLLVQWFRSEQNPYVKGTHFALVDVLNGPVWQLTLRDDYMIRGGEKAEDRFWKWFRDNSAVRSVEAPGRFDLFFARAGERVSFAAVPDGKGNWLVEQIDRKPFRLPPERDKSTKTAQSFPEGQPIRYSSTQPVSA